MSKEIKNGWERFKRRSKSANDRGILEILFALVAKIVDEKRLLTSFRLSEYERQYVKVPLWLSPVLIGLGALRQASPFHSAVYIFNSSVNIEIFFGTVVAVVPALILTIDIVNAQVRNDTENNRKLDEFE